jgi:hypothetical protein
MIFVEADRGFVEKYRDAFRGHMAELANVLFPFGTYWMRKFGKVACEAADLVGAAIRDTALEPVPT